MMMLTTLLAGDRLREREMAEAQVEVSSVVVLCRLLVCVRGCVGVVLQLCEDAVEGCAGAAGGGEWDPWDFRLEWGGWWRGWRVGAGV